VLVAAYLLTTRQVTISQVIKKHNNPTTHISHPFYKPRTAVVGNETFAQTEELKENSVYNLDRIPID